MFRMNPQRGRSALTTLSLGLCAAVALTACNDDDDPMDPANEPTSFTLTIRNISDGASLATPFAPGVWALTESSAALFDAGMMDRGEGLEGVAEDGATATLLGNVMAKSTTLASGMIGSAPLMPGSSIDIDFEAEPGARLFFGTMFGQSNDLFYAPGESGIALFSGDDPVSGDITSQVSLWDAGTEINEEPGMGANQAPRQSGPNTGATEGLVQRVSDGFSYPDTDAMIRVSIASTPMGNGADFQVTIDNLEGSPTPLAPGAWVTHTGNGVLFESGMPDMGHGLEALAEDGDNSALGTYLSGRNDVEASGVFGSGPAMPGSSHSFMFSAEPGDRLSFATMYGQSNDLFFAPNDDGIDLFPNGSPLGEGGADDVTSQVGLWDAGTEINEEPGVGMYQAPRQSGPNTGPTEGIVQQVMDGFSYPATSDVIEVILTVN